MIRLLSIFLLFLVFSAGASGFTITPRVVGGTDAPSMDEFSYQVAVYAGNSFCGGVIVADKWVLSAAHCFSEGMDVDTIQVAAGSLTEEDHRPESGDIRVNGLFIHPKYDGSTEPDFDYDIAALRLAKNINEHPECDGDCDPISYVNDSSTSNPAAIGETVIVSGWGDTDPATDSESLANNLQYAELKVVVCGNYYPAEEISERMVCATESIENKEEGRRDACQGDSGGPLASDDQQVLVGLVSAGPSGCGKPGTAGIYTRISSFVDWIDEVQTDHYEESDFNNEKTGSSGSGLWIGSLSGWFGGSFLVLMLCISLWGRLCHGKT